MISVKKDLYSVPQDIQSFLSRKYEAAFFCLVILVLYMFLNIESNSEFVVALVLQMWMSVAFKFNETK